MLADVFGGEVGPANLHEIGIFKITPTSKGLDHPLLTNLPILPGWVNVHLSEVKQPPRGAIVLARSDTCKNQVMSLGENAYSCQFHPEVCDTTLTDWLAIPGIVPLLKEKLGETGFAKFKLEVVAKHPELILGAKQLFENCGLHRFTNRKGIKLTSSTINIHTSLG